MRFMKQELSERQLKLAFKTYDNITLELKPFIQPFERILAKHELDGLLRASRIDFPIIEIQNNIAILPNSVPYEKIKNRLAYWQRIGREELGPTKQVLLEMSYKSIAHGENGKEYPSRRKLRYGPHDVHEYRGKFFPQLVKALINFAGLREGALVLDPMCGSGTTNCEARSMGMKTIGLDLNPLSVKIAETKTGIIEISKNDLNRELDNILSLLDKYDSAIELEKRWGEDDLKYLRRWFFEDALKDIYQVLDAIESCSIGTIRSLAEIALSNILRKISWQKEKDLRVRKEVKDYEREKAQALFKDEINKQKAKLSKYLDIIQANKKFPLYWIVEGDSRKIDSKMRKWINKCDVLITSPPYAMALPYIDTDRLSLVVLGLLPRKQHQPRNTIMIGNREVSESQRLNLWESYKERRSELPKELCELIDRIDRNSKSEKVGFRKRNLPSLLAKYFMDMTEVMRSAHRMMKPGSYGFFIVGNNSTWIKDGKIEIPTNEYLWEIGKTAGWKQEETINMELLPSRDIFKNNRGSSERILVFRT